MSGGRKRPNYFCYPFHRRGGEPIFKNYTNPVNMCNTLTEDALNEARVTFTQALCVRCAFGNVYKFLMQKTIVALQCFLLLWFVYCLSKDVLFQYCFNTVRATPCLDLAQPCNEETNTKVKFSPGLIPSLLTFFLAPQGLQKS